MCLSPADYADYAEKEYSKAALFRRERQVVVSVVIVVIVVIVALGFGVCLRKSAGSARDIGGSFFGDCLSTLM